MHALGSLPDRHADLPEPDLVVWMDSPLGGALWDQLEGQWGQLEGLTVPADLADPVTAAAYTFDLGRDEYAALERAT
jgi:hypothetical protein